MGTVSIPHVEDKILRINQLLDMGAMSESCWPYYIVFSCFQLRSIINQGLPSIILQLPVVHLIIDGKTVHTTKILHWDIISKLNVESNKELIIV